MIADKILKGLNVAQEMILYLRLGRHVIEMLDMGITSGKGELIVQRALMEQAGLLQKAAEIRIEAMSSPPSIVPACGDSNSIMENVPCGR